MHQFLVPGVIVPLIATVGINNKVHTLAQLPSASADHVTTGHVFGEVGVRAYQLNIATKSNKLPLLQNWIS